MRLRVELWDRFHDLIYTVDTFANMISSDPHSLLFPQQRLNHFALTSAMTLLLPCNIRPCIIKQLGCTKRHI